MSASRGLIMGLFSPILIVHLTRHGISLLEIGLLGAVLEITRLLFEIPSGIFSDRFGEKLSIQLSCLAGLACWAIFSSSDVSFLGSSIAMISLAIGGSLISGSFESWISKHNTKEMFSAVLARSSQIMIILFIVGAIVSGHIFKLNPAYPFIASGGLIIFMLVLATMGKSAATTVVHDGHRQAGEFGKILKESVRVIARNKGVAVIMAATFLINMGYDTIERYWQPLVVNHGFSEEILGYMLATSGLVALSGLGLISKVKSEHGILMLAIFEFAGIGLILAVVLLAGIPILAAIVCLLALGRVRGPTEHMIINESFPERYKATLFSLVASAGAAGEILAGVILGFVVEGYGIELGFLVCAGILGTSLLLLIAFHYRRARNYQVTHRSPTC